MENRPISIFAMCNPLMDFITQVKHEYLKDIGAQPGTMNLIDQEKLEEILATLSDFYVIPGGSGANTVRGFAWLAGKGSLPPPVYCGAVGKDGIGDEYVEKLCSMGVTSRIVQKQGRTGVSLVAVTPDSERTMFTFLGACRTIGEADIDFSLIKDTCILHITGYMWDTENQKRIVKRAAEQAHQSGTLVSFDIADPFVVNRYRDEFLAWIPSHVDILFGNRDECSLLGGTVGADRQIMETVKSFAPVVVMKAGERGAFVSEGESLCHLPAEQVKVHDTTGAGDAFAAGFLSYFMQDKTPVESAEMGNRLAGAIVQVAGCDYSKLKGFESLRR